MYMTKQNCYPVQLQLTKKSLKTGLIKWFVIKINTNQTKNQTKTKWFDYIDTDMRIVKGY